VAFRTFLKEVHILHCASQISLLTDIFTVKIRL